MGQYIITLPDDLHKKAKSEAALTGITLKEFIINALMEYVDKGARVNLKGESE